MSRIKLCKHGNAICEPEFEVERCASYDLVRAKWNICAKCQMDQLIALIVASAANPLATNPKGD